MEALERFVPVKAFKRQYVEMAPPKDKILTREKVMSNEGKITR